MHDRVVGIGLVEEQPLTVDELLCSLTVKEGHKRFDIRGVPVRKTLLNCCHGLVVIDQETSTVRLVHYSLQEYLRQQSEIFQVPRKEWHRRRIDRIVDLGAGSLLWSEKTNIVSSWLNYMSTWRNPTYRPASA